MSISTQPVKGARDFYPADMRKQNYIFNIWRDVCQRYGYEEYDAPILESTDLYLQKGSQEIVEEQTYTFTDRGGRSLTVRTEMTPSVSRMVAAKQQELGYPLRLFSIPQCWRYERMQRGRGREFYQLNADIFGETGLLGDHEIIELADSILQAFGATRDMYTIRVNSRILVDSLLLDYCKVSDETAANVRSLIDKKDKMDADAFTSSLQELLDESQAVLTMSFLTAQDLDDIPSQLQAHPSVENLKHLVQILASSGVTNVAFDPSLMRGFEYYTDVAFEVFDTDPENNRAMFGGGRYSGLVGLFGGENVSAVGFGMGDITLRNFLDSHSLWPDLQPSSQLYAVVVGDVKEAVLRPVRELRKMGVNVALDVSGRKLDKQIKTAEKHGIQHVLFIGEQELANGQYKLKNLVTGIEQIVPLEHIAEALIADRDSD